MILPSEKELIDFFAQISDMTERQIAFLVMSNPNYWYEIYRDITKGYLAIKEAKALLKRMEIN